MNYRFIQYFIQLIFIGFLATTWTGCTNKDSSTADMTHSLFPPPISVTLNTKDGYVVNPVTGDSIPQLNNYLGQIIQTGVPIKIVGKVVNTDSFAAPEIVK